VSDTTKREVRPDRRFLEVAMALYIDGVTAEVVTAMEAAGVPAIVLKGPSIAQWLYPTGGRTYGDTDLLVPPVLFTDAASVLRSIGFKDRFDGFHSSERVDDPAETTFIRAGGPGTGRSATVDLHRNLPDVPATDQLVWDTLTACCETMHVGGIEVRVLNRPARALHVALHAVHHQFLFHTDEDLRRAIDAVLLEDWRQAAALAARLGVDSLLGQGLRRHGNGEEIADRLGLRPAAPAPAPAPHLESRSAIPRGAISLSRIWAAPTVRQKARKVRWSLVPSPARAHELSRSRLVPGESRSLIAAYAGHWQNVAKSLLPAVRFTVNNRLRGGDTGDRVESP
jgi:hypothetical protein